MTRVFFTVPSSGRKLLCWFHLKYSLARLTLCSLLANDFADRYYVGEVFFEPIFWFVDHFTKVLGPICVAAVILLSCSLIFIAYIIGLPFYLDQSPIALLLAVVIGHWILINMVFYYYKAFTTGPGYPPQGAMISEAVSICKRCIAPKPPRTHHCIVCNRCILKMDHHCPWLNNCVGHFNHRYFFMFGIYCWIGVVFLIVFGIPIGYEHFLSNAEESLSPVIVQFVNTHLLKGATVSHQLNATSNVSPWPDKFYHSALVYAALVCVAVLFVLGGLLAWHSRLIGRGETSIENHINKRETERFLKEGKMYKNPYDFGQRRNWEIFLCVDLKRSWWLLLLPFAQRPVGNGLQWNMLCTDGEPNISVTWDKMNCQNFKYNELRQDCDVT